MRSGGLGQGALLVQHKQDFYRHVYERGIEVSLVEVNQTGVRRGREGGKIDVGQDGTALSGRLGHIPWPQLSLVSAQVAVLSTLAALLWTP